MGLAVHDRVCSPPSFLPTSQFPLPTTPLDEPNIPSHKQTQQTTRHAPETPPLTSLPLPFPPFVPHHSNQTPSSIPSSVTKASPPPPKKPFRQLSEPPPVQTPEKSLPHPETPPIRLARARLHPNQHHGAAPPIPRTGSDRAEMSVLLWVRAAGGGFLVDGEVRTTTSRV